MIVPESHKHTATGVRPRGDGLEIDPDNTYVFVDRKTGDHVILPLQHATNREPAIRRVADRLVGPQGDTPSPHAPPPDPSEPIWSTFSKVYELSIKHETQHAINEVFLRLNELMSSSRFEFIDRLLRVTALDSLEPAVMLAFLTATLPARTHLPARAIARERIEKLLRQTLPDAKVDALLKGL
jgi:hypothetical protein